MKPLLICKAKRDGKCNESVDTCLHAGEHFEDGECASISAMCVTPAKCVEVKKVKE